MREPVYLDWNATTPLRPEAKQAWLDSYQHHLANPASVHRLGQQARGAWERCADRCAALLGCRAHEIVVTSGGTEALALAIHASMTPQAGPAVAVASDHSAVLRNLEQHHQVTELRQVAIDRHGLIRLDSLIDQLDDSVRVVALHHANNELGVIQDVAAVVAAVREHAPEARVVLDACQTSGKMVYNFAELGVDFAALAGHKFGAPRGVGALVVRTGVAVPALLAGGRQQDDRRSGSEDVANFCALTAALGAAIVEHAAQAQRQAALLTHAFQQLQAELSSLQWLGEAAPRLSNTMNIAYPGIDGEALVARLDLDGICVSRGAACMAKSGRPSHVVAALGIDPAIARSAIRVSIGWSTSAEDLAAFVHAYGVAVRSMAAT